MVQLLQTWEWTSSTESIFQRISVLMVRDIQDSSIRNIPKFHWDK